MKRARESRGVSLREIATRTKISMTALEAMERDDFSRLPGGIFGRSFIRAYAVEVGLDPDATVVSFIEALAQSEREAAARGAIRPEITPEDRRFLRRQRRALRALQVAILVVVVVVLVLVAWAVQRYLGREPDQGVDAAPATIESASNPACPLPRLAARR